MGQAYFITGTDTNVGKTWATVALMRHFKAAGKTVVGMKPVASGSRLVNAKLYNDDALLLQQNASVKLGYDLVNPYAYEPPVSPHIAGKDCPVDLQVIIEAFNAIRSQAEIVLVEGAGGWYSPINDRQANSDLARALGLEVILVTGIRLGCINHARLTYEAINKGGLECSGWVSVHVDPDQHCQEEIVATLQAALPIPLLARLPHLSNPDFDALSRCFIIDSLTN